MILTKEWKQYLKELQDPEAIDTSSFEVQNTLNEELWSTEGKLDQDAGDLLYEIAKQFYNSLGLEGIDIVDVHFTGSLANYTWSKYSDIDLHILIDYSLIEEDQEFIDVLGSVLMKVLEEEIQEVGEDFLKETVEDENS